MQDGRFGFSGASAEPDSVAPDTVISPSARLEPSGPDGYVEPPSYLQETVEQDVTDHVEETKESKAGLLDRLGGIIGAIKEFDEGAGHIGDSNDLARLFGQGVTKAVDATTSFASRLVAPAVKKLVDLEESTPLPSLFPEANANFLQWYAVRDDVPLEPFGDEFREKHMGGLPETLGQHLVSFGGQISAAVVGSAGVVETARRSLGLGTSFAGQAFSGTRLASILRNTSIGAVADMTSFDGFEGRLTDLAAEFLPQEAQFLVVDYLKSDMDDSFFESRFKNAVEGGAVGTVVEAGFAMIAGAKYMARAFRAARNGDQQVFDEAIEQAARHMEQAEEASEAPGRYSVERNPDGTATLNREGKPTAKATETPEGRQMEFDDGTTIKIRPVTGAEDGATEAFTATLRTDDGPFTLSGEVTEDGVVHVNTFGAGETAGQAFISLAQRGDAPGVGQLGVRRLRALTDQIAEVFPEARRVEGIRTGSTGGREGREISLPLRRRGQSVQFESPEEAANVAAALDHMETVAERGPGLDEAGAELWAQTSRQIEEAWRAGDADAVVKAVNDSPINLHYVHNQTEAKSALAALGRQIDLGQEVVSHETTRKLADGLFPGMTTDEIIEAAGKFFGTTENLAQNLVALRGYTVGLARSARRLAEVALKSEGPVRAINMARLGEKLDELAVLTDDVAGAASNVGRALESQRMLVGARKLSDVGEQAQKALDTVANAKEVAEKARLEGDEAAKIAADKQLREAVEEARRLIGEEADSGIAGARAGDEVDAGSLPAREAGEGADEAAEGGARELSLSERADALSARMQDLIEEETQRASDVLERENITSPFAPAGERLVFSNMTADEIEQLAIMVFRSGNDPGAVLRQIAVPSRRAMARSRVRFLADPSITGMAKAIRMGQWLRLNGLLSGTASLARDILSTSLVSFTRPVEDALGALWRSPDRITDIRQAADNFAGLFQNYGEAWGLAKNAFMDGTSTIDPGRHLARHDLGEMQELWQEGLAGKLEAVFGMATRSRIAVDEFSKNVNYRAYNRAELLREGRAKGITDPDELAQFVDDRMRWAFGRDGDATMRKAMERAREPSFQQTLGEKGRAFEDAVQKSELAKFIMPFRRTPLNIVNHVWERTPVLNALNKQFRADLLGQNGNRAMQEAYGKMSFGALTYTTGALLAFQGRVTGGGPRQPGARQDTWRTAYDPYSVRIGDKTFSYNRLDPVMTPIGLIADIIQISGELDDETLTEAASAVVASVASLMSDKAVFSGLSEFLEAMTSNDENKLARFIAKSASSFVPTLSSQLNPDDVYRDARNVVEEILSRTPWSDNVEPRRNIFGAPVIRPPGVLNRGFNPLTMNDNDTLDRRLARELLEIGSYVVQPSPTMQFGDGDNAIQIDLKERGRWINEGDGRPDQSPYDRWMELYANTKLNGRTLREKLLRTMETDTWKEAEDPVKGEIAQALITSYRTATRERMLQEYPSLRNEITFARTMVATKSVTQDETELQELRNEFGVDERGTWTRLRNAVNGE